MKLEIKKWYFVVLLMLVGVGIVFAAKPTPVGHLISEIETCDSDGQIMKMSGGSWKCLTDGGDGGGGGAVNSVTGQNAIIVNPSTGDVVVGLDVCTAESPYLSWSVYDKQWQCSAGTASSGHDDGGNCGANQAAIGVDENGNAQGCWTPAGGAGSSLSETKGPSTCTVSGTGPGTKTVSIGTHDFCTLAVVEGVPGGTFGKCELTKVGDTWQIKALGAGTVCSCRCYTMS